MTENIFENGGEFCMRGDPEHKPVEWHWLKTNGSVVYFDHMRSIRTVSLTGRWYSESIEDERDLIPIRQPPQIVPWESPDDVPDGIWIRQKRTVNLYASPTGFTDRGVRLGNLFVSWETLFDDYEYHTDRRATSGWQPCGKVVKS